MYVCVCVWLPPRLLYILMPVFVVADSGVNFDGGSGGSGGG